MRFIALASALAITVGCVPADQSFVHDSTVYDQTRGLVVTDSGTAEAGMVGNTCQVDTSTGNIGDDVDVAMDDDYVTDAFAGTVLVAGTEGLHLYEPGDWGWDGGWGDAPDVPGDDITDGGLFDGGIVAVTGAGDVQWTGGLDASFNVGGAIDGLDVDTDSGDAYVVSGGVVSHVTPEGMTELADGDLVAWDPAAGVLYVATSGDTILRGIETDGAERFATELGSPIAAITGAAGEAFVSAGGERGGSLIRVDGTTGAILADQSVPGTATEMSVDDSGSTLAIVLRRQAHFFRVR